jgi:integrase
VLRSQPVEGATPRRVPLWPDALRAIQMTPRRLDSPLVVPAIRTGNKIRLSTLEENWKRAVFAAGIEPFRELYDLRHTHISWALRAGIPVSDVADWCGTSIVQIHKTYRHLIRGAEEDAMRKMSELTKYLSTEDNEDADRS